MATHPYISGFGSITQMVLRLRKAFPATVTSETVKKLGLAPNNESYVINALQFVGILDTEGKKTPAAVQVFSKHKDEDFSNAFEDLVKKAYSALFELHGEGSWTLPDEDLITFFRQTDQTSHTIGVRQAGTFKVFAALAGHGEIQASKPPKAKGTAAQGKVKKAKKQSSGAAPAAEVVGSTGAASANSGTSTAKNLGLSVRIEINLPADGTKETYDNIFKSIKDNLLNG